MDSRPQHQRGVTKIEWILLGLLIAIVATGLTMVVLRADNAQNAMKAAAIPVMEALDRYRAANGSYPDSLERMVPTYLPELPNCSPSPPRPRMAYVVSKDSGAYELHCYVSLFLKQRYSSKTRSWEVYD